MLRIRALAAVPATLTVLLVAGCTSGTSGSGPTGSPASASESNPLGDIPDNQVYVPYRPVDGSFAVKVPEGWARTDLVDGVSFTDKLNTVTVRELTARPQPTPDSVRS